jgi:1-acyl-sn-glycerol-3-phosphate acyltransferase
VRAFVAARRIAGVAGHVFHGLWVANVRLPGAPAAAREAAVQWWSRELLALMGIELRLAGVLAPGAVLVVANHVSWLDIAALHAAGPRIRFVSKAAVAHWPLVGRLTRTAHTLYIERERKRDAMRVVHEVATALKQGDAVGVFPEGTTGPGDAVLPFHANLLQAAVSTGTAVQPIVLRYSEPGRAVSEAAQYLDDVTLVGSVFRMAWARGVAVHVTFLEPVTPAPGQGRRELAQALRERIAARLADEVGGVPPARAVE